MSPVQEKIAVSVVAAALAGGLRALGQAQLATDVVILAGVLVGSLGAHSLGQAIQAGLGAVAFAPSPAASPPKDAP